MKIKILAFSIAKDLLNGREIVLELNEKLTISGLKSELETKYPGLKQLSSYMIALNNSYASPDDEIHENDEVAIIPPVSGG